MQHCRPRRSKESVPCARSYAHDARKPGFEIPHFHRPNYRAQVRAERPHDSAILGSRLHSHHQEYCCATERCGHRLSEGTQAICRAAWGLRIGLHRMPSWRGVRNFHSAKYRACLARSLPSSADERPCAVRAAELATVDAFSDGGLWLGKARLRNVVESRTEERAVR